MFLTILTQAGSPVIDSCCSRAKGDKWLSSEAVAAALSEERAVTQHNFLVNIFPFQILSSVADPMGPAVLHDYSDS